MLYGTIFILSFVIMFVIAIIKFYNILSHKDVEQRLLRDKLSKEGKEVPMFPYDIRMTWTLLFVFLFSWVINFMIFMLDPTEKLFMLGFSISKFFFLLIVVFSIIELIYKIEEEAQRPIKALGGK